MSYYETYKYPREISPTAGDPLAPVGSETGVAAMIDPTVVNVITRQPGESNAPRTHSAAGAGHRPLPPRVQAARRAQIVINAESGQRMGREVQARLAAAADDYSVLRDMHLGAHVGAWSRAADDHAGYLAAGEHAVRLRGAGDSLKKATGVSL